MIQKSTKRALLMSVLSLVLCVTMLMGTTFAWFTDSVTSGNNTIISGNLDVELYHTNDKVNDEKVNGSTELFKLEKPWEPGVIVYENLKVANEGDLALKYRLLLNAFDATKTASGKTLADVLKVAVVEDGFSGDRAAAQSLDGYTALKSFVLDGKLEADKSKTYGIVIWWEPTDNDNEFNMNNGATETLSIKLGVELLATQVEGEFDSFGNRYDQNATFPGTVNLAAAGGTVAAPVSLENVFAADTSAEKESVFVKVNGVASWTTGGGHGSTPFGYNDVTIAGNGAENSTFVALGSGVGPIRANEGGKLVMKDITVVDNSASYAEDSWEFTYLEFGDDNTDNLYFENVVFTSGIQIEGNATFKNCTFISEADSEYSVWVSGGTVSFEGCTFEGTRALKMHEDYGSEIASVTVDKCNFNNISKKPGIAIGTLNADTTVSITNSVFRNCQAGDQGLYIYETDTDVNTFDFTQEYNSVISEKTVNVTGVSDLAAVLSGAGQQGAGSTIIELPKDAVLDLSGTAWTPINVDGYHGADIVTVNGNGATIKGLTAPLFHGGFAGGSGIIIKNLTIADSDIVSTNGTGSGAFIEYMDSMELIELDNCHLINSTVTGSRTGGLLGWNAGYNNVNDGPVKLEVTVKNCSVVNCTINGTSSAGGIIGHAGNNAWTLNTIIDCTVSGTKINSTDPDDWRVGEVVGTANVGEVVIENVTCSGNTLTQAAATTTKPVGQSTLYGRFVPGSTGKLTIDKVEIK